MNFVHRGMTMAATIFLVSAACGTPGIATAAGSYADQPAATEGATMAAAQRAAPPAAATPKAEAPASTVRRIEADAITGSEPDPESFDRNGLESWWQHYQQAPKKAD